MGRRITPDGVAPDRDDLCDIWGEPPLPESVQRILIGKAQEGHQPSIDALLASIEGMVRHLAEKVTVSMNVAVTPELWEDCLQQGRLGALLTIPKFDFAKKARWSTYAYYWIRQAIQRYLETRDGGCMALQQHENRQKFEESAQGPHNFEALDDSFLACELVQCLTKQRRVMVEMYYGLGEWEGRSHSQKEIGEKLGVAGSRVGQVLQQARARMLAYAEENYPQEIRLAG